MKDRTIGHQPALRNTTQRGYTPRHRLHQAVPASPNELMAGLVSLARATDKARAFNAGTLGDYDYDCPHDKPLFEFLASTERPSPSTPKR